MEPRPDFPIEVISSNSDGQNGLKDPLETPWQSEPDDDEPSVTYRVDASDKPIEDINIPSGTNVASVTVEVFDQDGNPVSCLHKLLSIMLKHLFIILKSAHISEYI